VTVHGGRRSPRIRRKLPVSVTAVTLETLADADVRSVSDAAVLAPNTFFNESPHGNSATRDSGASAPARAILASPPTSTACLS